MHYLWLMTMAILAIYGLYRQDVFSMIKMVWSIIKAFPHRILESIWVQKH